MTRKAIMVLTAALALACWPLEAHPVKAEEIRRFPLDQTMEVISRTDVAPDPAVSTDGKGSIRVTARAPRVVRLFEVQGLDVENARLIYQARLKTRDVQGTVFLEMWCRFPGLGEYFSRGLHDQLSGTNDWSSVETPFFLQKGQKPDRVKLNLVVNGRGTVWIDDVRLVTGPLR
ncbi:MAG: hypothetical protein KKB20_26100 [Proteobacteria bacterium]|nr:hypothetical protein [Pseudomonadota bacterium]